MKNFGRLIHPILKYLVVGLMSLNLTFGFQSKAQAGPIVGMVYFFGGASCAVAVCGAYAITEGVKNGNGGTILLGFVSLLASPIFGGLTWELYKIDLRYGVHPVHTRVMLDDIEVGFLPDAFPPRQPIVQQRSNPVILTLDYWEGLVDTIRNHLEQELLQTHEVDELREVEKRIHQELAAAMDLQLYFSQESLVVINAIHKVIRERIQNRAQTLLSKQYGSHAFEVEQEISPFQGGIEGTCISCRDENVKLNPCPAGDANCDAAFCSSCAAISLSGMVSVNDHGRTADLCFKCKKRVNPNFFQRAGCDSNNIALLRGIQLTADLSKVPRFHFCPVQDCVYGQTFNPGEPKRIDHCPVCSFRGCLSCRIYHLDGFDSSGNCERSPDDRAMRLHLAMLEKRGKLAALNGADLDELKKLDQPESKFFRFKDGPKGTPCPICREPLGPEISDHQVGHHIYDGQYRPCPWCGVIVTKNEGCNHVNCEGTRWKRCPGDPHDHGNTGFSWWSGNILKHEHNGKENPMNHPADIRNHPEFKAWWPQLQSEIEEEKKSDE